MNKLQAEKMRAYRTIHEALIDYGALLRGGGIGPDDCQQEALAFTDALMNGLEDEAETPAETKARAAGWVTAAMVPGMIVKPSEADHTGRCISFSGDDRWESAAAHEERLARVEAFNARNIWACRRCDWFGSEPDSALTLNPATGNGYKAPLCPKCGQYFNQADIDAAEPKPEPIPGEIAAIFTNLLDAAKETLNECHAPHWRNLLAAIVEAEKIKVADLSAELTLAEAIPTLGEILEEVTGEPVSGLDDVMVKGLKISGGPIHGGGEVIYPSPGGEFFPMEMTPAAFEARVAANLAPPLDPNWQSIGDVAEKLITASGLTGQLKMVIGLLALLEDGRDLIEEAVRQHIYEDEDDIPEDDAYVAHIEAVDKLLGAA